MPEVEISVRGESQRSVPPERAKVRAYVGALSPDAAESYDLAVESANRVADSAQRLHDPERGPVVDWVLERVQTWVEHSSRTGGRLPPSYHASVRIDVEFSEFGALSTWLAQCAGVDGFGVDRVDWSLPEPRRRALLQDLRAEAVREAARRAQQYADALELGQVRVRSITDHGAPPGGPMFLAADQELAGGGRPLLEMKPQDLDLAAQVEATFVVPQAEV